MADRHRIPAEIERKILVESGHRCAVCGVPCPLERAHIIPWHQSKEHRIEDMICLCANCHERADNERWGEATLREYKQKPWVMRQHERASSILGTTATVMLTIKKLPHFDETFQEILPYAIAAFLNISPNAVYITAIKEDSLESLPNSPRKVLKK